jgi:transposase InsO family protein
MARTSNGLPVRMLNIIDEYTRECLCIKVARKITAQHVLEELFDVIVQKGLPDHIRSDNGAEFTAKAVRELLDRIGVKTLFIGPGSPWENGYIESFNGKLRNVNFLLPTALPHRSLGRLTGNAPPGLKKGIAEADCSVESITRHKVHYWKSFLMSLMSML